MRQMKNVVRRGSGSGSMEVKVKKVTLLKLLTFEKLITYKT